MNDWKALKFAFNRTPRTEDLFLIIDRYENVTTAYEGGNDGPFHRKEDAERRRTISNRQTATIVVHEGGYIDEINVDGLEDDDILDLSYLPRNLTILTFGDGKLTGIDLSKLPRGLEALDLLGNEISKMAVKSTPPSLRSIMLGLNPVEVKGITLHLPLSQGLTICVPRMSCRDPNGGQEHPINNEGNWRVDWEDGTWIQVITGREEVEFHFYSN